MVAHQSNNPQNINNNDGTFAAFRQGEDYYDEHF